jgi:hypothetical protein
MDSKSFLLFLAVIFAACASTPAPTGPVSPWSAPPIPEAAAPAVFGAEWKKSANRETCALLAPISVAENATPRRASFAGGWAVAYDVPGQRSAFGIAGTGAKAADPSYDAWPHRKAWTDGSTVGYGPEGGKGPNQLAYLRVAGQDCLYNVWSTVSIEHLEQLIDSLRMVDVQK